MIRNYLCKAGLFLVLMTVIISCSGRKERAGTPPPNIIWIYADDHDQRAISAYSDRLVQTPNIDRIAGEGILFSRSFVTNSICAPCRAVLLTGKHSHLNGVSGNRAPFDGSQQTFPKLLQKEGYRTALVGKWHLHSLPTGFDYWNILPGQGNYYNPRFIEMGDTSVRNGYVTDVTTEIALEFLKSREEEDRPFCLMLHQKAPHGPWMPAPEDLLRYRDHSFPVPATFFSDCSLRGTAACEQNIEIHDRFAEKPTLAKMYDRKPDTLMAPDWLRWLISRLSEEEQALFDSCYLADNRRFLQSETGDSAAALWYYQRYIRDYIRCVEAIDENVGRVLDYLDKSGLAENTIVFYSSDQGFYLGDHGWYDKRFMYDISMSTPLLARWPGRIEPGSVCDELVQNLDMAQTMLDLAGAEIPANMQGISLLPLLTGETGSSQRSALYYHYYEHPHFHNVYPHYGIRTHTSKLIHFYTLDEWEFYDLESDPQELINQIGNPRYRPLIDSLRSELFRLQEHYDHQL